jgi:hypothetical protein
MHVLLYVTPRILHHNERAVRESFDQTEAEQLRSRDKLLYALCEV